MVETFGWWTPRVVMHSCLASISTATPIGFSDFLDRVEDLRGHRLLRLQALGVDLDDAGELGDADDVVERHVGDAGLAEERGHVVLAVRFHVDVAQHDDVVIALHVLEGAGEVFAGVFAIALEPFLIGVDDAAGGVDQAFALGIVAGPGDQGADGVFGFVAGGAVEGFDRRPWPCL